MQRAGEKGRMRGVSVGKQRKSKAPVLADGTFYYGPIKQQALLGMQIPGEVKVHRKMKKNTRQG